MSEDRKTLSGRVEAKFGWDAVPRQYSGGLIGGLMSRPIAVDCDARAVFCDAEGRPVSGEIDLCCVYYGNTSMYDSAAVHYGDNQIGADPDDEIILFELDRIPPEVSQIVLTLDLFKEKKRIRFGKIQETFVRLVEAESGEEIVRSELRKISSETKLVMAGRIVREGEEWIFVPDKSVCRASSMEEFLRTLGNGQK